jgi:peptide-methionine (S)-S-oxide reductase
MEAGMKRVFRHFRGPVLALLCLVLNFAHSSSARAAPGEQVAIFSGGCFWGVEAVFRHVKGVTEAVSGYSGGRASTAHYDDVSRGDTGHAESVRVLFDPAQVSFQQLLQVFFYVAHDPTQLNRQGPDTGTQYRSAIFYTDEDQRQEAASAIRQVAASRVYSGRIVTQLVPLQQFYAAEAYHQNYLARHLDQPYIIYNDLPKLEALRRQFPQLWR